jgi:hypothetical protein
LVQKLIALKCKQKVLNFRKIYTPKFLGCYNSRAKTFFKKSIVLFAESQVTRLSAKLPGGPYATPSGSLGVNLNLKNNWRPIF